MKEQPLTKHARMLTHYMQRCSAVFFKSQALMVVYLPPGLHELPWDGFAAKAEVADASWHPA